MEVAEALKRRILIDSAFKYIDHLKCKIAHAYHILAKELEGLES